MMISHEQEKSSGRSAHYKLTSTAMLWLQTNKTGSGTMNLGGSLTRQVEQDATVSEASPHIVNIGRMVEVRSDAHQKETIVLKISSIVEQVLDILCRLCIVWITSSLSCSVLSFLGK